MASIRVSIWKGVPADVAAAVRTACARLPAVSPVRHRLTVKVVPHLWIETGLDRPRYACGMFCQPGRIVMAAGAVQVWQGAYGWSRRYAVRRLVFNLCHEYAHYEQWREGKPLTERGVSVRARTLLRLISGRRAWREVAARGYNAGGPAGASSRHPRGNK